MRFRFRFRFTENRENPGRGVEVGHNGSHEVEHLGFPVSGLGFRFSGLEFGVWGLRGLGFGVWGLGFGILGHKGSQPFSNDVSPGSA